LFEDEIHNCKQRNLHKKLAKQKQRKNVEKNTCTHETIIKYKKMTKEIWKRSENASKGKKKGQK
jgi:hypothetical protein